MSYDSRGTVSNVDLPPAGREPGTYPSQRGPSGPFRQEAAAPWDFADVLLLLAVAIPAFVMASLISVGAMELFGGVDEPEDLSKSAPAAVALQIIWSGVMLAFIHQVITRKYRLNFQRAIAWREPSKSRLFYVGVGVALATSVAALTAIMPMPDETLPLDELLAERSSLMLLAVYGILIAPLVEELIFRGFLYPVFEKAAGVGLGVFSVAVLFTLLHGQQYAWHWQNLVLLLYAGIVFGVARVVSRSVIASTWIHAAYNATFFLAAALAAPETTARL